MGIMINQAELEQVKKFIQQGNNKVSELWDGLYERTMKNTSVSGLLQPGDTQEWWHLIWERLSDAAFVQAVKPSDKLKEWLRCVVLEVCAKSLDEWIGPWFRSRKNPPEGQLETSHVAVAIATVYDLCPEIFTEEELTVIKDSLRTKGQEPCRVYVENKVAERGHINNWFMVLLNGFGTVAAVLDDKAAVNKAVEYYKTAASLYNKDSYGESVQYANYATIHLSHLNEVLVRYNPKLESRLDRFCYVRLIPWQVSSFIYMKPLQGWGDEEYPRAVNFGDSTAIYRPSGDVLLHIAARAKDTSPKDAGLARWLFEKTYKNTRLEPTERATFGFFNTFQFYSLLLYSQAADPMTPEQAGLPLTAAFETGTVVVRDGWQGAKTILGIQAGYEPNNVTSHRHLDQNSFMLAHLKERFFIDPGHCCYRLKTQAYSISAEYHNTWTFEVENNKEATVIT